MPCVFCFLSIWGGHCGRPCSFFFAQRNLSNARSALLRLLCARELSNVRSTLLGFAEKGSELAWRSHD